MLQKTHGYFVIQSPDHCEHECQKHKSQETDVLLMALLILDGF